MKYDSIERNYSSVMNILIRELGAHTTVTGQGGRKKLAIELKFNALTNVVLDPLSIVSVHLFTPQFNKKYIAPRAKTYISDICLSGREREIKPEDNVTRQALKCNPQGKGNRGRGRGGTPILDLSKSPLLGVCIWLWGGESTVLRG